MHVLILTKMQSAKFCKTRWAFLDNSVAGPKYGRDRIFGR